MCLRITINNNMIIHLMFNALFGNNIIINKGVFISNIYVNLDNLSLRIRVFTIYI